MHLSLHLQLPPFDLEQLAKIGDTGITGILLIMDTSAKLNHRHAKDPVMHVASASAASTVNATHK